MIKKLTHLAIALAFGLGLALLGASGASAAAKQGQTCGGFIGIQCSGKEFCQFPPPRCGAFDMTGQCTRVPVICPRIFRPVCGCDGKTYSNDCVRQAARVSKRHDGRCKAPY